jgi:hypothetical protein
MQITAGYIISDVERLRKLMQQISEHLMRHMVHMTPHLILKVYQI